jgi:hypothetical protein
MWIKCVNNVSLPMNGGVYVMYNRDNNIIYVGQSNSLKRRLSHHSKNGEWSYLKYKTLENTDERIVLEAKLIRRLRPELNKLHQSSIVSQDSINIRVVIPEIYAKALDIYQRANNINRENALVKLLKGPLSKELKYLEKL